MALSSRILLIDDNSQDRDYYAHRLKASLPDCAVLQVATGLGALTLCKQDPPDCVILELDLPDMSGFEVLLKLVPQAYRPEIPVVVLTRLHNVDLLKAAITNGAQAALVKILAPGDVLEKAVQKAMAAVPRDQKRAVREHAY
jgi:DNA-binding NarL/FixJ family response regulator